MGVWNVTAGFMFGRFTSSSWRAELAYYLMSCLISAVCRAVNGGALREGAEVEVAMLGLSSLENHLSYNLMCRAKDGCEKTAIRRSGCVC